MSIRKPIVAGQFYPADKTELEKQVKSYIKIKPNNAVKAIIVPHAGYFFSGKCAGKAYSILPEAETYVLLGVNHSGHGQDIAVSLDDFETPLGVVKNDVQFGKEILKQLNLKEDSQAHKYEHSLEVQLPFLQMINKTANKDFSIVPIILKNYNLETCKNLAKAIFQASEKLKQEIISIASSDFTHSGPAYGFSSQENPKNIDKKAINSILKFDSRSFLDISEQTTICGAGAICTVMELSKFLGAKKVKLLDYYTSADVMPGENQVGYASIAFLI